MKLRIPLLLLSLSMTLCLSYSIGLIWGESTQQIAYLLSVVGLIFLFEKTKMSERKVNRLVGIVIGISAVCASSLVELQDWSYVVNMLI